MEIYQGLPRTRILLAKRERGEELTDQERRQLEGYDAGVRIKNRPYSRGAQVRFQTDKGLIEGTIISKDDKGNYLIEFATNSQTVVKSETILKSYVVRQPIGYVQLDDYLTKPGKYQRVVDREGFIIKFYHSPLETKRIKGEEIILPESEQIRPGSSWGMSVRN